MTPFIYILNVILTLFVAAMVWVHWDIRDTSHRNLQLQEYNSQMSRLEESIRQKQNEVEFLHTICIQISQERNLNTDDCYQVAIGNYENL